MTAQSDKDLLGKDLAEKLETEKAETEAIVKAKAKNEADKEKAKKEKKIVIKNTSGQEVKQKDYFYSTNGEDAAPSYFHNVCGYPVEREDMIAIFDKVFDPKHGVLFYKTKDKEVYIIIVPIKFSSTVGFQYNSIEGEFQKHAISFIGEGSVNLDTLRMKLAKVASTIKFVV